MKVYFKLLILCFFTLGVLGFFSFGRAHLINVSTAFDLILVASIFIYKPVFSSKSNLLFFIFLTYYFIGSLFIALFFQSTHILDFLLAYKSIFYLAIMFYFQGKIIGSEKHFNIIFRWLVIIFFFKYLLSVGLGLNDRPLLFRENNFELMFLALIYYLKHIISGRVPVFDTVLIVITFLISGSKSAIPILFVILVSIYIRNLNAKKMVALTFLSLLFGGVFSFLILSKYGISGLGGIDRIAFFRVFIMEMIESNWLEILFGHMRVSPLSELSCQALYYYPGLFSYKNDGTCYSLILHSFILRSIFDHGVLGTIAIFYCCHWLLLRSGYDKRVSTTFLLVMFLNSLSVSSFNSVFFALSILFYLGFRPVKPRLISRQVV